MVFILGISGPTSSGKTFFTNKILEAIKKYDLSCNHITTDEFYLDRSNISFEERTTINYDDPKSINKNEFYTALKQLASNKATKIPVYDYNTHTRTKEIRFVEPSDLIIIEGIFTLSFPEINTFYDLTIFVELEVDLRLIRRIQRDTTERGRSMDSVINQYLTTVRPTQAIHVERDRNKADIIIQGNRNHASLIQLILSYVKAHKKE